MSPRQAQRQHGFTLIELILVITILGVISVSVAQVISLSAQIYITGAERNRLVSDARFIILRLEKNCVMWCQILCHSIRVWGVFLTTQLRKVAPMWATRLIILCT